MKPYYQDEFIELYCGNLFDVLPQLPDADAIIADPPYGETHLGWDSWPDGWPAAVKSKARQLWCFGSLRMFTSKWREFDDWKLAQDVVWEKNNGSARVNDRFRRIHDHALHFYRGKWSDIEITPQYTYGHKPYKSRTFNGDSKHSGEYKPMLRSSEGERLMTSIIRADNCRGFAINETQKPEGIIAPLLRFSVPPGGLVLDPFAGGGTTLYVARKLGMKSIGIELREEQCAKTAERLGQQEMALA